MDRGTALVLGATGGIGGETARALVARGWRVRAMSRAPARTGTPGTGDMGEIEWVRGDAMVAAEVVAMARGATIVVHAVNPPGYRDWDKLVLPMLDNTVAAARAAGARIVLPGTVYNYGPDAFADLHEDAPQDPVTVKGRIRVEMERRLAAAAAEDVPVLIVRAGDFFGPRSGNTWFAQGLLKPGRRPRVVRNPGRPGVGHQWAYLPDVAETMLRLLAQPDLPRFARYHMDGHWDPDGRRMTETIARLLGDPRPAIRPLPWWALRLASPVVPTLREMMEMRYLWEWPVRMRNDRLVATLGEEPRTPLDVAVRSTLVGLGCLGPAAA